MSDDATSSGAKQRSPLWRLLLLATVLLAIYVIGKTTGLVEQVSIQSIRSTVEEAGAWGVLLFIALFAVGVVAQVPGMLFVAAGILIWGRFYGYFVSLSGAIVAVCASFLMARAIGGEVLSAVKRPFIRKILAKLDEKPLRVLIILRLVMFISPPLNYALALSKLRFRDFAIGSALGLVTPMVVVTFALDWVFATDWAKSFLFT